MAQSKLIWLEDNLLIEADAIPNQAQPYAASLAQKCATSLNDLVPLIRKICGPISSVWKELNQEMSLAEAELEVGIGFEAEGNVYVAKSTATANLVLKIKFASKILQSPTSASPETNR